MRLDRVRLAVYIGGFLAGVGFLLSVLGYAEYDHATGYIDIAPFNVYALSGVIAGPLASALATIALWLGWGPKK